MIQSKVVFQLMSLWPFYKLILASAHRDPTLPSLFHFGDASSIVESLAITNRLTAFPFSLHDRDRNRRVFRYIFLIDRDRLIRWKACGSPTTSELECLKNHADRLTQSRDLGRR